jgi:hypothetical protein
MTQPDVRTALLQDLADLPTAEGDLGETIEMARDLAERIRPYAAQGFVCLMAPMPPTRPVSFPGVDGIVRAWQDFGDEFRSVHAKLERVVEAENALILLVRQTVVTEHGGVELTQPGALVITIEGDRVSNVQFHLDQDEALRAGGAGPEA